MRKISEKCVESQKKKHVDHQSKVGLLSKIEGIAARTCEDDKIVLPLVLHRFARKNNERSTKTTTGLALGPLWSAYNRVLKPQTCPFCKYPRPMPKTSKTTQQIWQSRDFLDAIQNNLLHGISLGACNTLQYASFIL